MKKSVILMLFIFCQSLTAKEMDTPQFPEGKNAIFIGTLQEGKVYASLEKLTIKKKAKGKQLIGHAQMVPLKGKLSGQTKVVIGWIGVQKTTQKSKAVAFKEPIVSSFIIRTQKQVSNIELPLYGDINDFNRAVDDLEQDKIDKDDLKIKRTIKMPKSLKRHVTVANQKLKTSKVKGKMSENKESQKDAQLNKNEGRLGNKSNLMSSSSNDTNSATFDFKPSSNKGTKKPSLSVNSSAKMPCPPRVDREKIQVIVQERLQKMVDGEITDVGACMDTDKRYAIERDYLCEGCTDVLEISQRVAYSRYREFWQDSDKTKHWLSDSLHIDNEKPFHFFDERDNCEADLDLELRLAYPQVKTFYNNGQSMKVLVEGCHRDLNAEPIPITQTFEGCDLIHDFANKISFEQQRLVYTMDNQEFEARGCMKVEPGLIHQFIPSDCQPLINLVDNTYIPQFKRQITTHKGVEIISNCEPGEVAQLSSMRRGCEGQFVHEFGAKKSYLQKRYYFGEVNNPQFVTDCVRVDEFINHESNTLSWEHHDDLKLSYPKIEIGIHDEGKSIRLKEPSVRKEKSVAFVLEDDKTELKADIYYEGCFKRTKNTQSKVYRRVDNTYYNESNIMGDIVASTINECTTTYEKSSEFTQGSNICWYQRSVTVNPKGQHLSYSDFAVLCRPDPSIDNGSSSGNNSRGGHGSNW